MQRNLLLISLLSNDGLRCELLITTGAQVVKTKAKFAGWTKKFAVLSNLTTQTDYSP